MSKRILSLKNTKSSGEPIKLKRIKYTHEEHGTVVEQSNEIFFEYLKKYIMPTVRETVRENTKIEMISPIKNKDYRVQKQNISTEIICQYISKNDYKGIIENIENIENKESTIDDIIKYYTDKNETNSIKNFLTILAKQGIIYAMYRLAHYYESVEKNAYLMEVYCLETMNHTNNYQYKIDMCTILINHYNNVDHTRARFYMWISVQHGSCKYVSRFLLECTIYNDINNFLILYQKCYNKTSNNLQNDYGKALYHFIDYYSKSNIKDNMFISLFKLCYSFDSIIIKQKFIDTLIKFYDKKTIPKESLLELCAFINCDEVNIDPIFRSLISSVQLHLKNVPKNDTKTRMELLKQLV